MNYIPTLIDSIETSVSLNLYDTIEEATNAHLYKSSLIQLNISNIVELDNFNINRLHASAEEAYPIHDRPRGDKDISSVKYNQNLIKNNLCILPIWLIDIDNKLLLLDGAHRIVASYIENKQYIDAYIISYDQL